MRFKSSAVGGLTFYTLLNDQIISKSVELYGEWTFGEIELLARLLPKDANVIELGSNIGAHSVFIAKYLCPDGTLYAFEPRRLYFQTLCANLVANGISNAHAFQLGAGDRGASLREGAVPTRVGINAGGYALGDLAGADETIDVVALDDRLDDWKKVALLKADIEGYELAALRGAERLIARDRPLLYLEANDRAGDLLNHLAQLGYAMFWHTPHYFRKGNRGGAMVNIFGQARSWNLIAWPLEQDERIRPLLDGVTDLHPATDPAWHPRGAV